MNCKMKNNKFISDGARCAVETKTTQGKNTMKTPKTMRDNNGNNVPLKYVSSYDRARDAASRRIHRRFIQARKLLESVVAESIQDLDKLASLKESLGDKGNFSTTSFDGLIRVSIRQRYNIFLDERVVKARELMLKYVNGVLSRVGDSDASALRLIVSEAFKANSQGFLSTSRIFSLLRMEINDHDWRDAKGILQNCIIPQKGKRYLTCDVRPNMQADFSTIRLDIADCWPEEVSSEASK